MNKEQLGDVIVSSKDTMYRVAIMILKNDADCADAISESIVTAFSKLHTLKNDSYAKTWLIRILINECYASLKRKKRLVCVAEFKEQVIQEEYKDYSILYREVRHLPEKLRICIELFYVEELSIKEITEILKISESAVKNRLARARKLLKNKLMMEDNHEIR